MLWVSGVIHTHKKGAQGVHNGSLHGSRTLATGARGRTLWTGSTRLTEAQGARGEVLRGRSVTLLGVTNGGATDAPKKAPGRTEPATKKARGCNHIAISFGG